MSQAWQAVRFAAVKIATFNVNSVRARMGILTDWLAKEQPDLVALQETKAEDAVFPMDDIAAAGYQACIHGQKSYNGVAFLSRQPMEDVAIGYLPDWPTDCRAICGTLGGIRFINTYVPNGTSVGSEKWAYKMKWLEAFPDFARESADLSAPAMWLGDINIAPTPDDVFESKRHLGDIGHHPDEFERLAKIVDAGEWTDCFRKFTDGPGHYTFWDFRMRGALSRNLGWRIDHIYANPALVARVERCWVDREPRGLERPSDHTPVLVEIR